MSEQVLIAAAGYGTRLRPFMDQQGYAADYPKHLLPTGAANGETFLGRIIRQALPLTSVDSITVHVNHENKDVISQHADVPTDIRFDDSPHNHSLDMFFERLATTNERVVGCAGDFYAEDNLRALIDHHEAAGFPVTVLAGFSVAVDGGVSYGLGNNGKVTSMHRVSRTMPTEPLNIGAYIFEPDPFVMRVLRTHRPSAALAPRDDRIFEAFVRQGLLGAYVTNQPTFNVNTPETYQAMLNYTQPEIQQAASA